MQIDELKVERKDYASIERGEKKYKRVLEANSHIRSKAIEIANVLSEYSSTNKDFENIDFEIYLEILNDVSFTILALESNLYYRMLRLNKNTSERVKERICLAFKNYIVYWLKQID